MKVAVIDSQVPFDTGEGEWLAGRLCDALREHGHASELIRIPFRGERPETVVEQMLAARLIHLDNIDRAVALRFPAYLMAHQGRVVWLHERYSDRWPALPGEVAASVRAAERAHLAQAAQVHARSAFAARTLARDTGVSADVLYAPLRDEGAYRCEGYGEHLLLAAPAAVTPGLCVALAALARSRSGRMMVACPPGTAGAVTDLARRLGAEDRVETAAAPPGTPDWIALLAGARAVVCTEDPCEEIAREAFSASKPVIALADCGCTPGLLGDGVSGRVAATLEELAAAYDELAEDAALAERFGDAGAAALTGLGISWATVVTELTR